MNSFEFCRVCTKPSKVSKSKKLFEKKQKQLVKQIKEITGLVLKNSNKLPRYICKQCQQDLEEAHKFRKRCIFAQEYFKTKDYLKEVDEVRNKSCKEKTNSTIKDELPIEENHILEICFVKEETSEDVFLDDESMDVIADSCYEEVYDDALDLGNDDEIRPNVAGKVKFVKTKEKLKAKRTTTMDFEQPISTVDTKKQKLNTSLKKIQKADDLKRTFICDQCGNNFSRRQHFIIHLRRHTGDKQCQCEICPAKFLTHSELTRHMRKHTGEKPFTCQHCRRSFSDNSTRIKHERTHTNERPFACKQCPKAFTTSYLLKNHILVHTGERSFRCDSCNKAFQTQSHLVVHHRSIMHQQNEEKQQQKSELSNRI